MAIKLGDRVRDKISGFQGIATGRTEWLYGCIRFFVQPEALDNGKLIDGASFDEEQLERIATLQVKRASQDKGGPRPDVNQPPKTPRA